MISKSLPMKRGGFLYVLIVLMFYIGATEAALQSHEFTLGEDTHYSYDLSLLVHSTDFNSRDIEMGHPGNIACLASRFVIPPNGVTVESFQSAESIRDAYNNGTQLYGFEFVNTGDWVLVRVRESERYGILRAEEISWSNTSARFTFIYESISGGEQTYSLSVDNGSGDGSYDEGQAVTITADAPSAGMIFDAWTGDVGYLDNPGNATAIVTMPAQNISVTATYIQDSNAGEYPNLVYSASWEGLADDLGSTVSIDSTQKLTDTLIAAQFSIVQNDEANEIWPWAQISAYSNGDYRGVTSFTVTYSSDLAIKMSLDQQGLAEDGLSYSYELPASAALTTVNISINQFAQPEWVETESDLDLSQVLSISFSPVGYNLTANITLNELIPVGYETTPIRSFQKTLFFNKSQISQVGSRSIVFKSAVDGKNVLELYNLRGVLLNSVEFTGRKNQSIHINDFFPSSRGYYLVRVKDEIRTEIFKISTEMKRAK